MVLITIPNRYAIIEKIKSMYGNNALIAVSPTE